MSDLTAGPRDLDEMAADADVGDFEREPTAIERAFFTPLYNPDSAWQVVGWWESRRLLYNAAVGGAGVVTMLTAAVFGGGAPPPAAFIVVPVVYGALANACYTLGWIADLALRKWLGRHAHFAGPALLRYGFVFSIGLTLLPIPLFRLQLGRPHLPAEGRVIRSRRRRRPAGPTVR